MGRANGTIQGRGDGEFFGKTAYICNDFILTHDMADVDGGTQEKRCGGREGITGIAGAKLRWSMKAGWRENEFYKKCNFFESRGNDCVKRRGKHNIMGGRIGGCETAYKRLDMAGRGKA
jgi:hypothetical protein